ncbi:MAG: winged helix-turn-helix domain-containing protein, partial [Candidatus Thermoplasmatota archaeon]
MCNCNCQPNPLKKYVNALHCPTRWKIIRYIGEENKSTKEIYDFLSKHNENITASGLYYHLSELKKAGIIKVYKYKEEGGGAPEKIWKLKTKKIVINLLSKEKQ